jgi:carbonic anhydrase
MARGELHLHGWVYKLEPTDRLPQAAWAAVALAFVASAESLPCAVATDKLHDGPRANLDRELVAQGVGNVLSGLVGGLPITGVIVRSTANISAGARTRLSAILHGLWIVLFVAFLGPLMTQIPLAALAALLVVVGVKLLDPGHVREVIRHREGAVYFSTLAGVVCLNLLAGIAIGVALATVILLRRRTRINVYVEHAGARSHVRVEGALTFLGVPRLMQALSTIPPGQDVDIDLDVEMIDYAGFEALHSFRISHEKTGGRVDLDHLHERWSAQKARSSPTPADPGRAIAPGGSLRPSHPSNFHSNARQEAPGGAG